MGVHAVMSLGRMTRMAGDPASLFLRKVGD